MDDSLRYPIGPFTPSGGPLGPDTRAPLIERIRRLPARARAAAAGLDDAALDTPYRQDGWTPRQILHHIADSHVNSIVRFKLALTEDHPTVKPYAQARWAELADSRLPTAPSLALLDGLHARWVVLLESLSDDQWARTVEHPEIGSISLDFLLEMYAWHGDHHCTQVEHLRDRMGW